MGFLAITLKVYNFSFCAVILGAWVYIKITY